MSSEILEVGWDHFPSVPVPFCRSGTAFRCCRRRRPPSPHPQPVDAMDLAEKVLMLALLHKKISKKETSSPVLGSSSALYKTRNGSIPNGCQLLILFINNSVSN